MGGDVQGPAPLVFDGRSVGSAWQRRGDEPDPGTFAVVDPADRGRSYLYLTGDLWNGARLVAHQAIFTWPVSSHGKQLVLDNRKPSAPQYLVTSRRAVCQVSSPITGKRRADAAAVVRACVTRRPSRADRRATERRFGGSRVFREGRTMNEESYSDNAIDDFEVFAAATRPSRGTRPSSRWSARTRTDRSICRSPTSAGSTSRWNGNSCGPS